MITMNQVDWFEIPARDLQRAKSFYEAVFDCELEIHEMQSLRMAWFPVNDSAPGSGGALVQGAGYEPCAQGSVIYFSVDEVSNALRRVQDHGGKIIAPKSSIGQQGFIGQFEDTEGNRVAVHSMI